MQPAITSKEGPQVSLVHFLAGAQKALCLDDATFHFSFILYLLSLLVQNDGLMWECLDFIYAKIIFSIWIWVTRGFVAFCYCSTLKYFADSIL